jgi:hypothetical protein
MTRRIKNIVNELCCSTSGDSTFSSGGSVEGRIVGFTVVVIFSEGVVTFLWLIKGRRIS